MASNNVHYGNARMHYVVHDHRPLASPQILEALFGDIRRFVDEAPIKDDMTAIVVKSL